MGNFFDVSDQQAIFTRNKGLFESLTRELIKSPEGQAILAKVSERYPNLKGNEFFKEAIVNAIGEYASGMIEEQGKGLGQKLFELIQKVSHQNVNWDMIHISPTNK